MTRAIDLVFMSIALDLSRRGLGRTWPQPTAGCVIVDEAASSGPKIIARGWSGDQGQPTAVSAALTRAGDHAKGKTVYVSYEPCAREAQASSCSDLLVNAGIARVIIGARDANPSLAGTGIAALREAGLEVFDDVMASEAETINIGYERRWRQGRPFVTLKLASTIDGQALSQADAKNANINTPAQAYGHLLRATHDAVLIGSTTALLDNPELTCRLPGLEGRSPLRVITDSRLRLPLTSNLAVSAQTAPTWVLTLPGGDTTRVSAFKAIGIDIIEVDEGMVETGGQPGVPDLGLALQILAARGITRVLAEGGAKLAAALLNIGAVDRLIWVRGAAVMGGSGQATVASVGADLEADLKHFALQSVRRAGERLVEVYEPVMEKVA